MTCVLVKKNCEADCSVNGRSFFREMDPIVLALIVVALVAVVALFVISRKKPGKSSRRGALILEEEVLVPWF